MSELLTALERGLMLGDGAIGTLLYQRGQPLDECYDALNLTQPDVITQLHLDYLTAGARLIETNTFGANQLRLEKYGHGDKVREINLRGAELALAAAQSHQAFVAGSVGPLTTNPSVLLDDETKRKFYAAQCEALA